MGGQSAKHTEQRGPIVAMMQQKYGKTCTECLPYWTKEFGFPENGSLSAAKLKMLRGDLEARLKELRSGKKVKVKDLEMIEKNQTCLAQWEMECECRERKQMMKK